MKNVVVIDYGIGNLFSVKRALEYCGACVTLTEDPEIILSASHLVLPGVGAFEVGMNGLINRGLDHVICKYTNSDKPFLGICLGMQMLVALSEEFGLHKGLGIIPGRVLPIPMTNVEEQQHKIPFIGWAPLVKPTHTAWNDSILADVTASDSVYLVHSYAVETEEKYLLANYHYNGRQISAAIRKKNIYGTQFHPEKSGAVGLKVLRSFLSI